MKIKARSKEEWKGSDICEAVLTAIDEIYHAKGGGANSAKIEEIEESVKNHPDYSTGRVSDCLNNPTKESCYNTVTVEGGYQVL